MRRRSPLIRSAGTFPRMAYTRALPASNRRGLRGQRREMCSQSPVSHGEGRFVAEDSMLRELIANGQIATQYTTPDGVPDGRIAWNPNGSVCAVEGITSPDGRIFGKMGHSERQGADICRNVPGEKDQRLFESGVRYFR